MLLPFKASMPAETLLQALCHINHEVDILLDIKDIHMFVLQKSVDFNVQHLMFCIRSKRPCVGAFKMSVRKIRSECGTNLEKQYWKRL